MVTLLTATVTGRRTVFATSPSGSSGPPHIRTFSGRAVTTPRPSSGATGTGTPSTTRHRPTGVSSPRRPPTGGPWPLLEHPSDPVCPRRGSLVGCSSLRNKIPRRSDLTSLFFCLSGGMGRRVRSEYRQILFIPCKYLKEVDEVTSRSTHVGTPTFFRYLQEGHTEEFRWTYTSK